MSQKKYITKERKFKHLDMYQRGKIEVMLKMKIPKAQIARELGISRSTLYEEIKRGTVQQLTSELRHCSAVWSVNTYTITYTVNGEEFTTQTYEYGAEVSAPKYTVS